MAYVALAMVGTADGTALGPWEIEGREAVVRGEHRESGTAKDAKDAKGERSSSASRAM